MSTINLITVEQRLRIESTFTTALSVSLTSEKANQIISQSTALKLLLKTILRELGDPNCQGGKVDTNLGYPRGFRGLKSVEEQIGILRQHFDFLNKGNLLSSLVQPALPTGAQGILVMPHWDMFARSYGHATEIVFEILHQVLRARDGCVGFKNYCTGKNGLNHLTLRRGTQLAYHILQQQQPGQILCVPIQCGLLHRGESVEHAIQTFMPHEFGLGPLEVAILLITHPERLTGPSQLYLDCPGAEFHPNGLAHMIHTAWFSWCERIQPGEVHFATIAPRWRNHQSAPVTGFIPESYL